MPELAGQSRHDDVSFSSSGFFVVGSILVYPLRSLLGSRNAAAAAFTGERTPEAMKH